MDGFGPTLAKRSLVTPKPLGATTIGDSEWKRDRIGTRWREGETGLDQVLRSPPPLRLVNGMQSMTRCRRQQSHPTRADRQKKDTHQTSPRRGKVKIEDCRWSAAGTRPKRHIASADKLPAISSWTIFHKTERSIASRYQLVTKYLNTTGSAIPDPRSDSSREW